MLTGIIMRHTAMLNIMENWCTLTTGRRELKQSLSPHKHSSSLVNMFVGLVIQIRTSCPSLHPSLNAAGLSPSLFLWLAGYYCFSLHSSRFRSSTWQRLAEPSVERLSLSELLDWSMRRDPLWPILTPAHLKAIDRRLGIIINTVQQCIDQHGREKVIVDNWP